MAVRILTIRFAKNSELFDDLSKFVLSKQVRRVEAVFFKRLINQPARG